MDTIIITGATQGIGFECALQLAAMAKNEQIIITARNLDSGKEAVEKIKKKTGHNNVTAMLMDLGSLVSIRRFKDEFVARQSGKISALVNNAGLQTTGKTRFTKDGFEETFGVNHLGPFCLTLLLLPYMKNDARISFTSSGTHDPKQKTGVSPAVYTTAELLAHPPETSEKPLTVGQRRYATSKLCNIMTVYALHKHLKSSQIHVNALDPGLVPGTGLVRDYPAVLRFVAGYIFRALMPFHHNIHTAKVSGRNLANLVYAPEYQSFNGQYFEGKKVIPSSEDSYKEELQADLWKTSIQLSGITKEETIAEVFQND